MKLKQKYLFAHMDTAWGYSKLSHCERLKVGAALVTPNGMIAPGYNGRPPGEPNVGETEDNVTHVDVRHAEVNALKKLIRSNESAVGSIMCSTDMPCKQCAIDIVDAGVKGVVYERPYRDISGVLYLIRKGVQVYNISHNRLFEVSKSSTDQLELYFRDKERYPEISF